jgi:hypothetical protein
MNERMNECSFSENTDFEFHSTDVMFKFSIMRALANLKLNGFVSLVRIVFVPWPKTYLANYLSAQNHRNVARHKHMTQGISTRLLQFYRLLETHPAADKINSDGRMKISLTQNALLAERRIAIEP